MNKRRTYVAAAISLGLLLCLLGFTRPNIDNAWLIIIFFSVYYAAIFFGVLGVGFFLKFSSKKVRQVAVGLASLVTAMQLLITFQALRPLELLLITSVLIIAGWYISKARE